MRNFKRYMDNVPANTVEGAIRHGHANVNGIRLHYAESGSGENLVLASRLS